MVKELNKVKIKGKNKTGCFNHSHLTNGSVPHVQSFFLPFLFGGIYND